MSRPFSTSENEYDPPKESVTYINLSWFTWGLVTGEYDGQLEAVGLHDELPWLARKREDHDWYSMRPASLDDKHRYDLSFLGMLHISWEGDYRNVQ